MVVLAIFGFVLWAALAALWKAYVLTILWGWFIVPTFALPQLSLSMAYGFALVVSMLTLNRTGNEAEKDGTGTERLTNSLVISFCAPAVFLLFGWITTKFI